MRTITDRLLNRLMRLGIPALVVALVCVVSQLYVPSPTKVRQLSMAYVPTATIDTSSTAVGISDSDLYFMSAADVATTLDTLKALGVTQVRVFVPWALVEAKANVYDWTNVDKVVNAAADRGMAVLAAVTSTPQWAGGTVLAPNNGPKTTADYAQFMTDLAGRYSAASNNGVSKVSAYEVWNEPNGFRGWGPAPNAAAYTALLKAAYTAIKSADADATVIGGVVGAGLSFGSLTLNPVTFVQQMYANGAKGYFDALSFHPYQTKLLFSKGDTVANSPLVQLRALRALMDQNGDTTKLIWSTEYGLSTASNSDSTQASFIADFLSAWSSMTGVGPMFIYNARDREANSTSSEDNFGIFYNNWTPKQAAEVIAAWIAAHSDPSTPTDPTDPTTPTNPTDPTTPTNPTNPVQDFFTQVTQAVNAMLQSLSDALKAALAGWGVKTTTTTAKVAALSVAAPVIEARIAAEDSVEATEVVATPAAADADVVTTGQEVAAAAPAEATATEQPAAGDQAATATGAGSADVAAPVDDPVVDPVPVVDPAPVVDPLVEEPAPVVEPVDEPSDAVDAATDAEDAAADADAAAADAAKADTDAAAPAAEAPADNSGAAVAGSDETANAGSDEATKAPAADDVKATKRGHRVQDTDGPRPGGKNRKDAVKGASESAGANGTSAKGKWKGHQDRAAATSSAGGASGADSNGGTAD